MNQTFDHMEVYIKVLDNHEPNIWSHGII